MTSLCARLPSSTAGAYERDCPHGPSRPLRPDDTPMLFLAVIATLARLPDPSTSPLQRYHLVRQMLKQSHAATRSLDILDALTDELLALSQQFPTFDALLLAYDTAVTTATYIAVGLEMAVRGEEAGTPLFAPRAPAGDARPITG